MPHAIEVFQALLKYCNLTEFKLNDTTAQAPKSHDQQPSFTSGMAIYHTFSGHFPIKKIPRLQHRIPNHCLLSRRCRLQSIKDFTSCCNIAHLKKVIKGSKRLEDSSTQSWESNGTTPLSHQDFNRPTVFGDVQKTPQQKPRRGRQVIGGAQ